MKRFCLHGCVGPGRGWVFPVRVCMLVAAVVLGVSASPVMGQGMPLAARTNIHTLFDNHTQVHRTLTLTADGYEALTESTNSHVATALQAHVRQMQERLDSGLAARRWDPAFAEYRSYYDKIDIVIEPTDRGVKVVAHGQTPDAIKVAQNHAKVIDEFVQDGWEAHDRSHPAALTSTGDGPGPRRGGRGFGRQAQGSAGEGCGNCGEQCRSACCQRGSDAESQKQ